MSDSPSESPADRAARERDEEFLRWSGAARTSKENERSPEAPRPGQSTGADAEWRAGIEMPMHASDSTRATLNSSLSQIDPASAESPARPARSPVPPGLLDVDHPVDPGYLRARRLAEAIECLTIAPAAAGLLVWYGLSRSQPLSAWFVALLAGGWALLTAALILDAIYWPPIDCRRRSWRLDARAITIRRGVFWREVVTVPRSRIQHIDVGQGPIERRYGLAHLVIHTAGTISASVRLEGLSHARAVDVRDYLLDAGGSDAI